MKNVKAGNLVKVRFVKGKKDLSTAEFIRFTPIGTEKTYDFPLLELIGVDLKETLVLEDCFTAQVMFSVPKNAINDGLYNMELRSNNDMLATITAKIYGNDNIEQFIKRT